LRIASKRSGRPWIPGTWKTLEFIVLFLIVCHRERSQVSFCLILTGFIVFYFDIDIDIVAFFFLCSTWIYFCAKPCNTLIYVHRILEKSSILRRVR